MMLRSTLLCLWVAPAVAFATEPEVVDLSASRDLQLIYTPPQPPDPAMLARLESELAGSAARIQTLKADPDYRAAHRNAWERFMLAVSDEVVASSPGFVVYESSWHSHHTVPGPSVSVFGMEAGHDQAATLMQTLSGAPIAERERLVAELRALQRELAAKKRAPLPYCAMHTYATAADAREAKAAAEAATLGRR